jgi:hypothetical protein
MHSQHTCTNTQLAGKQQVANTAISHQQLSTHSHSSQQHDRRLLSSPPPSLPAAHTTVALPAKVRSSSAPVLAGWTLSLSLSSREVRHRFGPWRCSALSPWRSWRSQAHEALLQARSPWLLRHGLNPDLSPGLVGAGGQVVIGKQD